MLNNWRNPDFEKKMKTTTTKTHTNKKNKQQQKTRKKYFGWLNDLHAARKSSETWYKWKLRHPVLPRCFALTGASSMHNCTKKEVKYILWNIQRVLLCFDLLGLNHCSWYIHVIYSPKPWGRYHRETFLYPGPFVRVIHPSPMDFMISLTKGQECASLFSLMLVWISCRTNSRVSADLRIMRRHCNVFQDRFIGTDASEAILKDTGKLSLLNDDLQ